MLAIGPGSPEVNGQEFNLGAYLEQRNQSHNFVMVEFGHGLRPAAFRQSVEFTDQRVYIGIEPWLRNSRSNGERRLYHLQAENSEQSISFIDQDLDKGGTRTQRRLSRVGRVLGFVGLYDPSTILPDGAADEILLSNVFGDPQVAGSKKRTKRLLDEVGRLTAEQGMVVIRETITPLNAQHSLTKIALQNAGLKAAKCYSPTDEKWESLEAVYGAGKRYWHSDRFYQFLIKTG